MTESDIKALEQTKDLRRKVSDFEYNPEETARTAGGFDKLTGKRNLKANINREEAAWVNKQAAEVYRAMGIEQEANKREMMSRFYRVDNSERNSMDLRIGKSAGYDIASVKVVPRYKDGEYAITLPEGDESLLMPEKTSLPAGEFGEDPYKLETRNYEKKYKIVETTWRNGKPSTEVRQGTIRGYERNYQMEGSVKVEGKMVTEEKQYSVKNGKRRIEIKSDYIKTETYRSPELNPKGVVRANQVGGAVALVDEWNKWMMFSVNSRKATETIAAMDRAKVAHFIKNNYPAPPQPKDLPIMRNDFERAFGKEKANKIMKFVEEASYAVWGSK